MRVVGLLPAIGSCAYLGHVPWQATNTSGVLVNAFPEALPWAAAMGAWTLAMALLASGWHPALNAAGAAAPASGAAVAYALSQPAKYLPGNVLHFAARHVLGRSAGHPHTVLLQASMVEALSLIFCVALAIAACWRLPELQTTLASGRSIPWAWTVVGLAALVIGAWALRARLPLRAPSLRYLLLHALCALGYFLLTSLAFWILAGTQPQALHPGQLLAASALSWVGGFVVFGAPGEIGVREALLFQLLAETAATPVLLAIAVAFRVSLIAADPLLFALAVAFWRRAAA